MKKKFIELLLESYGLTPKDVKHYFTSSNGGEYQRGIGWEGSGVDNNGVQIIRFAEPDGFNMAVYEILKQAKELNIDPIYIPIE